MADWLSDSGGIPPHRQEEEAIRFVTFRLEDAIPANQLRQRKEEVAIWRTHHPKPWTAEQENEYHRRFTWKLESWLDEGAGSCLMSIPARRKIMEDLLMDFQGDLIEHHAWIIMPNHVHLICTPFIAMENLIKIWKDTSAHRIGRGNIWQENFRNTPIPDATHFANAVHYLRRNPTKLREGTFTLWQGPRALAVE